MESRNSVTTLARTDDGPGMPVQILDWRPMVKNTLRGFVRVQLGRALVIHDVTIGSKDGKSWASLPSKPMVGRDGGLMHDNVGKLRYAPVIEWSNVEARWRFSNSVVTALLEAYPGALDGDAS